MNDIINTTDKIPEDDMSWSQWPKDIPRPTQEEWDSAFKRYRSTCVGDYTDYVSGLAFVMATYARWVWWEFFFPEDTITIKQLYDEMLNFYTK